MNKFDWFVLLSVMAILYLIIGGFLGYMIALPKIQMQEALIQRLKSNLDYMDMLQDRLEWLLNECLQNRYDDVRCCFE